MNVSWRDYAEAISFHAGELPFETFAGMSIDDKAEWLERLFHEQLKRMTKPSL